MKNNVETLMKKLDGLSDSFECLCDITRNSDVNNIILYGSNELYDNLERIGQTVTDNVKDILDAFWKKIESDKLCNCVGGEGTGTSSFFDELESIALGATVEVVVGGLLKNFGKKLSGISFKSILPNLAMLASVNPESLFAILTPLYDRIDWEKVYTFLGYGQVYRLSTALLEGLCEIIEKPKEFLSQIFSWEKTHQYFDSAQYYFGQVSSSENWFKTGENILLGIMGGIDSAIFYMHEPIDNLFAFIWENICETFDMHSPSKKMAILGENILLGLLDGFSKAIVYFEESMSGFWNSNVLSWFSEDMWTFGEIKTGLVKSFNSAITAMKCVWNSFSVWLNDALTFKFAGWSTNIETLWGTMKFEIPAFEISLGSLPTFQTGGFPEDGLFLANQNELIGGFSNGKTVVANNEQITEGISAALYPAIYSAVTDAMNNSSATANVTFEVVGDAKGIFKIVRKEANEYASVTGKSPFPLMV